MSELDEMSCEDFAWVAAELALGVLTGRERAAALEHLDRCDACRKTVRQLSMTGDELLGLLPSIEPPPGFETRVLDRLGPIVRAIAQDERSQLRNRVLATERILEQEFSCALDDVPSCYPLVAHLVGWWDLACAERVERRKVTRELRRLLPDQDKFWPRWIVHRERPSA